jgi:hypothetical protein
LIQVKRCGWQRHYGEMLSAEGFVSGRSRAAVRLRLAVNGSAGKTKGERR